MMRAPESLTLPGVSGHDLGRSVVDRVLIVVQVRQAGVGFGHERGLWVGGAHFGDNRVDIIDPSAAVPADGYRAKSSQALGGFFGGYPHHGVAVRSQRTGW